MGIKENYAARKLRKLTGSIHRKPELPELDSIKKVGVIWQPAQKEAFLFLQDYFSKKQVIFRSICVYDRKNDLEADGNSLTLKDVDWLGFPKPGKTSGFTEIPFDLLLNIALKQNITLDYITAISGAKFKIGWSEKENNFFDLNINIGKNQDALYLAKQQIFYLAQLNKKTSG